MKINHQIRSLQFELTIPIKENGFEIQERINSICQEKIVKILEESFNQIDQPDVLTRIDRLELDIGIVNRESLETDICEKLAENLHDYLKNIQYHSEELTTKISQISLKFNLIEQLTYFLKTGKLPWNAEPQNFQDFDQLILQLLDNNPNTLKQIWQENLSQTNISQRLIFNLQESTLELLILKSIKWSNQSWQNLKKIINFISEQLFSQEISSVKKLKRWDNLISILSLPKSINIEVFWQQWLEQELQVTYFIPLESKSEIWLTFKNTVTKYISSQSPSFPVWLQDIFYQHLEKINQQLNDSSSDIPNEQNKLIFDTFKKQNFILSKSLNSNTIDKNTNNIKQNLSNNQGENNTNNSSNFSESPADTSKTNSENKYQEFPKIFSDQNDQVSFINNSGLVLLYPYLSRYLEALNYVQNNQFISFNHQLQAVHCLEHLVRGEEDYREYDLVLNKVLLGLPLATPIDHELSKLCFQSQEVTELLESAINHWQILGKTSVDGFRQSFLKREGKLIEAEDHCKLIVNRKGYDILLSKLPYPLYVIKLSWMNQPLYVEW